MIDALICAFPLWAILFSALAWLTPQLFMAQQTAIVPLLAVVMFGMGLTLTRQDFKRVVGRPAVIGFGVLLQYACMPLFAWLVALAMKFFVPVAALPGAVFSIRHNLNGSLPAARWRSAA